MRIRIERRGNSFTMLAGKPGGPLTTTGPVTVTFTIPSTSARRLLARRQRTRDGRLLQCQRAGPAARAPAAAALLAARSRSSICATNPVRTVYQADTVFEAPNWSSDGKYLLVNSGGRLYRIPVDGDAGAKPEPVNIDPSLRLNNDHAPSPDGKMIAFSRLLRDFPRVAGLSLLTPMARTPT